MNFLDLVYIPVELLIFTILIHQMRYTYKSTDYSRSAWFDSFITAFILELIFFSFGKISILFPKEEIEKIRIAKSLFSGLMPFAAALTCKVRYQELPWGRIFIYITFAFVIEITFVVIVKLLGHV